MHDKEILYTNIEILYSCSDIRLRDNILYSHCNGSLLSTSGIYFHFTDGEITRTSCRLLNNDVSTRRSADVAK